jgi:transcriptional regulator with XRE-family HTH domain
MDLRELWQPDSEAIRRLRRERGWSRFELATRAGVSPHTLARAERGLALFPSTLRLIAEALDKNAEELCSHAGAKTSAGLTKQRLKFIRSQLHALDLATLRLNAELAAPDLEAVCHEDVMFSMAMTGAMGIQATSCRGIAAFVRHLHAVNAGLRREAETRLDEILPLGTHQILCTAVDRTWDFTLDGSLTCQCASLYTFQGDRIASIQHSVQLLSFNGQCLPDARVEHVPPSARR